jgi:hypothetical protein
VKSLEDANADRVIEATKKLVVAGDRQELGISHSTVNKSATDSR